MKVWLPGPTTVRPTRRARRASSVLVEGHEHGQDHISRRGLEPHGDREADAKAREVVHACVRGEPWSLVEGDLNDDVGRWKSFGVLASDDDVGGDAARTGCLAPLDLLVEVVRADRRGWQEGLAGGFAVGDDNSVLISGSTAERALLARRGSTLGDRPSPSSVTTRSMSCRGVLAGQSSRSTSVDSPPREVGRASTLRPSRCQVAAAA